MTNIKTFKYAYNLKRIGVKRLRTSVINIGNTNTAAHIAQDVESKQRDFKV